MGSAARRRGAYGGEYLRAGLRLRARGGRRLGKIYSQTRVKKSYRKDESGGGYRSKSHPLELPLMTFYSGGRLWLRGVRARLRSHRSYRSVSLALDHSAVGLLPERFCQALERAPGLGRSRARRAIEGIAGGLPPGSIGLSERGSWRWRSSARSRPAYVGGPAGPGSQQPSQLRDRTAQRSGPVTAAGPASSFFFFAFSF
jgi:hypothetical protein